MRNIIKEHLLQDPLAKVIVELAKAGKTKGNRLYVPRTGELRKKFIKECYNTLWAGHPRWQRNYALIKKGYFWSNMRHDIMQYTKTCLICQQDKIEKVKVSGLLQPLPVPTRSLRTLGTSTRANKVSQDSWNLYPCQQGLGKVCL